MSETTTEAEPVETAVEPSEDQEARPAGIEGLARELGWKAPEEWKGEPPPGGILGPEEFLKHTIGRQDSAIRDLRRDFGEAQKALDGYSRLQERAYQRALKEIETQQERAVEEGDTSAFKAAQSRKNELEQERQQASAAPPPHPDFPSWQAENAWYGDDVERTAYADQIAPVVARKLGVAAGRPLYEEVAKEVAKKFPGANNARRQQASAVESGGRRSAGRGRSYADLPAEDKTLCDRMVRLKQLTRDEFIKSYPWES